MRRVVVTGMGAVTPVGNHLEEYWNSLVNGVCGVDFITRFDASEKKVQVAAEVKGFDPLEYFEKSELRKNDLFVQYAVAAAAGGSFGEQIAEYAQNFRLEELFTSSPLCKFFYDCNPVRLLLAKG